jgi:hypothetical protein
MKKLAETSGKARAPRGTRQASKTIRSICLTQCPNLLARLPDARIPACSTSCLRAAGREGAFGVGGRSRGERRQLVTSWELRFPVIGPTPGDATESEQGLEEPST